MIRTTLGTLICALLIFSITKSALGQKVEEKWTPKEIINTEYASSVAFSPDNQMVVWTKRVPIKKKDRFTTDIYLTRLNMLKDGMPRTFQLTNSEENDYSPLFSADGEHIYFLSGRDEGKKLWKLNLYGGEPEEVHEFENGISSVEWLDEETITFTAKEGKTLYEQKLKEKKDNTIVVEDSVHWTPTRVYAFSLKDKSIRRLTNNDYPVSTYALSRDGKWLVARLTMSRHYAADASPDPKYYLYNLADGGRTEILEGLQTPSSFNFSADNEGFYFSAEKSSDPEWNGAGISLLYYFSLADMNYKQIDLDWEWGVGGGYELVGNDILVSLANGATRKLAFYAKDKNWKQSMLDLGEMNEHVSVAAVSKDGSKAAYIHSTAAQLPRYYVANTSKKGKELSFTDQLEFVQLNKKLYKKPKTKYEVMKWKGYNDEEVTGILYYPSDYEEGKRYPLMLSIHGGPSGVDTDRWSERWSTYPNILAQRGAFVLKPNYHGSSNHGLEFVESIKKNYYTPELADILKGIEKLDKEGKIDMDKLGTMGWSNGAILTTMLTVRYPDMFKVAAPGAGDVNWTSDFGTCRFGVSFDQSYFGGAPWDDTGDKFYNEQYIAYSPLFEMEKVKTPTIIFHGSEDRAVPRDQGWEYYRSLQQIGEAPVRFLWFPGQPHGLQKITHQLRKMEEELKWIDRFLFETADEKNDAFKEDSPLAMLLKRDSIAMTGGLYGMMEQGKLMPEVVAVADDSISIGRFEVTNAQFAAYSDGFDYETGTDNHPAKVSFEQAKGYASWLNEQIEGTFRLPSSAEAKAMHKKAMKSAQKENTLNYWAGYEITPHELDAFREKLGELAGSLIKAVGSHNAIKMGEAELYDIGGNMAEFDADGNLYGYSAYNYVDALDPDQKVEAEYTGFRVVKE